MPNGLNPRFLKHARRAVKMAVPPAATGVAAAPAAAAKPVSPRPVPSVRVVLQRVDEASLLIDNVDTWVRIGRGLVIHVAFMKTADETTVDKLVATLTSSKVFVDAEGAPATIIDTQCDVLLVPQASLAGRLRGKFHDLKPKSDGQALYQLLAAKLASALAQLSPSSTVHAGTYGNRQGLQLTSTGPFTTLLDQSP